METIDRILMLLEWEKLEQQQFCKKIGVAPATFSSLKNRKSSVKDTVLYAIKKAYPKISLDWLIMGTGGMWLPEESSAISQIIEEPTLGYGSPKPNAAELLREIDRLSGQVQVLKELLHNK